MEETSIEIVWQNMVRDLKDACTRIGGPGVLGYALADMKTGREVGFRENVVFPTASTIKIAILLGVASKVKEGHLDWEQRIRVPSTGKVGGSGILSLLKHEVDMSLWDISSLMIALSDNDATNICIDLAGMDYVNSLLRGLGLQKTSLCRHMMDWEAVKRGDENVSTPGELVALLRKLYRKDGIAEDVASQVLTLLELPKGGPFRLGLPAEVRRANKPGGLDHVSVDAGVIYLPGRDFCFAVMGGFLGNGSEDSAQEKAAEFVRAAYAYMDLLAKCTELGRS